jgi:hypothetical protein
MLECTVIVQPYWQHQEPALVPNVNGAWAATRLSVALEIFI